MMLSPSQAESFDRCPRRYVLERRLKLGEAETLHMVFGSLIHDVLEATESAAIADDAAHGTAREALAHLDRLFDPADFGGEPWATAWHRRAVECLERLYGRWPEDSLPVREVEKPLEMDLGGARWVGRADRVEADDGDIHIVDYKTSRSPMTRAEAERSLQLAFYALAIEADATGRVTAAELWYPAARRTAVPVLGLDLGRLDELRDRLEEVAAAIRAEDWTPTPGDHCERCRMRQLCPAWPEGAEAFA
jgi:RecB family exonuclease